MQFPIRSSKSDLNVSKRKIVGLKAVRRKVKQSSLRSIGPIM